MLRNVRTFSSALGGPRGEESGGEGTTAEHDAELHHARPYPYVRANWLYLPKPQSVGEECTIWRWQGPAFVLECSMPSPLMLFVSAVAVCLGMSTLPYHGTACSLMIMMIGLTFSPALMSSTHV